MAVSAMTRVETPDLLKYQHFLQVCTFMTSCKKYVGVIMTLGAVLTLGWVYVELSECGSFFMLWKPLTACAVKLIFDAL